MKWSTALETESCTDVTGKTTQYTYSSLDLLEKVWDDGRELATFEYNADGTIQKEQRGPLHRHLIIGRFTQGDAY